MEKITEKYNVEFDAKVVIENCDFCPFLNSREESEYMNQEYGKLTSTIEIVRVISVCGINQNVIENIISFGGTNCPINVLKINDEKVSV